MIVSHNKFEINGRCTTVKRGRMPKEAKKRLQKENKKRRNWIEKHGGFDAIARKCILSRLPKVDLEGVLDD